jgi:formylglycine-generating enzyme required for sulfatase activity
VPAFQASRLLVSNGEFLEFVTAGGYAHDAFWDDEGRRWRDFAKAMHPTFWVQGREGWRLRLMTQVVEMPWNWPVEVNCLEARAFCRWRAQQTGQPVRLPTEDEWHSILATSGWQLSDEQPANANLYLGHWASSCPVDHFKHGPFFDVVGNAWQWTETPTYPFEGFKTHPIYDDFTTPPSTSGTTSSRAARGSPAATRPSPSRATPSAATSSSTRAFAMWWPRRRCARRPRTTRPTT